MQNSPAYVLSRRLRNRLYYALRNAGWKKPCHFAQYIGCDYPTLLNHIESQFQPGMSWADRGKFHIDHVIPLSSAQTPEEMVGLCHYKNLKPLWALDNIRKADKLQNQQNSR